MYSSLHQFHRLWAYFSIFRKLNVCVIKWCTWCCSYSIHLFPWYFVTIFEYFFIFTSLYIVKLSCIVYPCRFDVIYLNFLSFFCFEKYRFCFSFFSLTIPQLLLWPLYYVYGLLFFFQKVFPIKLSILFIMDGSNREK